jgi:hypothetical protein
MIVRLTLPLLLISAPVTCAHAGEVFGGLLVHDVKTPLSLGGFERGADLQLGWRGNPIGLLGIIGSPSPYVFGSLSTSGQTDFVAAGISWKIGSRLYVRPGVGVAVHDRKSFLVGEDGFRRDLGSRVLFEPEIGVGYQISNRLSAEASWVHLSQGQIFSGQNPGMDSIGLRLNYRLR